MQKIPSYLKQYFWDVDFTKLDFWHDKTFILKRVLDRGNDKALKWLLQHYTKADIKELILTTRDLSPKTANFWADFLNVDKKEIPSLKNPPVRKTPVRITSEYLNRPL